MRPRKIIALQTFDNAVLESRLRFLLWNKGYRVIESVKDILEARWQGAVDAAVIAKSLASDDAEALVADWQDAGVKVLLLDYAGSTQSAAEAKVPTPDKLVEVWLGALKTLVAKRRGPKALVGCCAPLASP